MLSKAIVIDQPDRIGLWAAERLGATWAPQAATAIGLVEFEHENRAGYERIIAGVLFTDFNGRSIQMHVAAEPGARWMTKAYLGFCFQYAFNQAKVAKILGLVGEGNLEARRFDEHLGFRLEATLRDAHPTGDLLVYSMTREQCRWLNIHVPKESLYGQAERTTRT